MTMDGCSRGAQWDFIHERYRRACAERSDGTTSPLRRLSGIRFVPKTITESSSKLIHLRFVQVDYIQPPFTTEGLLVRGKLITKRRCVSTIILQLRCGLLKTCATS